jgi:primosomal protein N' (replication factor Y)
MQPRYVDIAVPIAVDTLFTYLVPAELQGAVKRGVRVLAPFGKKTVIGVIVNVRDAASIKNLKTILDVLDDEPMLSEELLELTQWISEYYYAPHGEVIKAALVPGLTRMGKRIITLTAESAPNDLAKVSNNKLQSSILKEISRRKKIGVDQLQKVVGTKNLSAAINELVRTGMVKVEEQLSRAELRPKLETVVELPPNAKERMRQWLATNAHEKRLRKHIEVVQKLLDVNGTSVSLTEFLKQHHISSATVKSLEQKKVLVTSKREVVRTETIEPDEESLLSRSFVLTTYQQTALDAITDALSRGEFHAFLLHGITASGKTQVYIEAIRYALLRGKTAVVLVPEISLTPQIVKRFKAHFGNQVVALHSRMSVGERSDAWRLLHQGKYTVAIGPRSALFAPLKNLGLIVVDEEHEPSYKQFDQTPRYHARDAAVLRAKLNNAVAVLGSATPSLESYANAVAGKYTLLELPERIDDARLPTVAIVDMVDERKRTFARIKQERKENKNFPKVESGTISELLKEKISDRLARKEGIILLQNRRGFSSFIECPDCGYVEMCENCHISLTYHLTKKHLRCHYCGFVKSPPLFCPSCGSVEVLFKGFGTQRVEEEINRLFPAASLLRMDLDTTTRKGSHDKLLKKFGTGEADILLGTQMVAKGLDFSRVTLVGVISADTQMLLPDFRASERTFQLLTQVAGRAGRSSLEGEVIIQTYQPTHYALKHVVTHDFKSFYQEELQYRKELQYPPMSRLALLEFRGEHENNVMQHAEEFSSLLKKVQQRIIVLGPAPAAIAKLKQRYRWHLVLKSVKDNDPAGTILHRAIQQTVAAFQNSSSGRKKNVQLIIDVDPISMM